TSHLEPQLYNASERHECALLVIGLPEWPTADWASALVAVERFGTAWRWPSSLFRHRLLLRLLPASPAAAASCVPSSRVYSSSFFGAESWPPWSDSSPARSVCWQSCAHSVIGCRCSPSGRSIGGGLRPHSDEYTAAECGTADQLGSGYQQSL